MMANLNHEQQDQSEAIINEASPEQEDGESNAQFQNQLENEEESNI